MDVSSPAHGHAHDSANRGGPEVGLVGGFELSLNGRLVGLSLPAQRLMAFLALNDRPASRPYVAGALWPETSEEQAAGSLRSAMWRLRQEDPRLVSSVEGKIAIGGDVDVDLRERIALAQTILHARAQIIDVDPALLFKDLLPDWYDEWAVIERERYRQLRLHALDVLCEHLAAAGDFPCAIDAGLAAIAAEPLRESSRRALIKAHLAEGNYVEAFNQYRIFREMLRRELALDPAPETEELISCVERTDGSAGRAAAFVSSRSVRR